MTSNRARLDELLRLVREDLATPEVLGELHGLIAQDDRALQDYIRAMHFQASLNWLLEGEAPGAEAVRVEVRRLQHRRRRKAAWTTVLTTVATGVLIAIGYIQFSERRVHDLAIAAVVGEVTVVGDSLWSPIRPLQAGSVARIGHRYQLLKGVAQLQFAGGAQVNLEGPATLHVDGPQRVTLHQGRLLAEIPPAAIGFTVKTPSAEVVDLGTQFGVAIGDDGAAEFHVLKGQVRTAGRGLPGEELVTDQAARYTLDGQARTSLPAERRLFQECLRLAAGLASLSGRAQYVLQPEQLFGPEGVVPQDLICVFRERAGFSLPEPLSVVGLTPSVITTDIVPERVELPAGLPVDVFFLHLSGDRMSGGDCQLTFTRPVLGLICEPDGLTRTDTQLGFSEFNYEPVGRDSSTRGALLPAPTKLETGDRLTVSPDRRTLTFHLSAGKPAYDQIRILVESETLSGH
jgi:hypothetical protein